jgi:hypothetical protein
LSIAPPRPRHEMRIGELGLGAGLMALVFYSSRHDYDR